MATDTLEADSPQVMPTLERFKICGAAPFWSAGDCANIHREQAYALLTMLAQAFDACDGLRDDDATKAAPITSIRPRIIGQALEGIAALVALSQHATDRADAKGA